MNNPKMPGAMSVEEFNALGLGEDSDQPDFYQHEQLVEPFWPSWGDM